MVVRLQMFYSDCTVITMGTNQLKISLFTLLLLYFITERVDCTEVLVHPVLDSPKKKKSKKLSKQPTKEVKYTDSARMHS